MKTQRFTTESKTLHVTGYLWSGGKCSHEYSLHVIGRPELEGVEPQTLADAKRIAGDFSDITSAKVVTLKSEVTETRTTRKL